MIGNVSTPLWLEALLHEKFFKPCLSHEYEKKCDKNTFCLDCCTSLCLHCFPLHPNHNLLQIRRYVYQAVLRLSDAQKVIECASVQPYTTNNAKVVFINHKPALTRHIKRTGNICTVCDRTIQDPYIFCSLSCKVRNSCVNKSQTIMDIRPNMSNRHLPHDSMFELSGSIRTTSSRSRSISNSSSSVGDGCALRSSHRPLFCIATTTEFTNKNRSSKCRAKYAATYENYVLINRRKGVPHRSPMY